MFNLVQSIALSSLFVVFVHTLIKVWEANYIVFYLALLVTFAFMAILYALHTNDKSSLRFTWAEWAIIFSANYIIGTLVINATAILTYSI